MEHFLEGTAPLRRLKNNFWWGKNSPTGPKWTNILLIKGSFYLGFVGENSPRRTQYL